MLVFQIALPLALLVFGICWYLHIIKFATGKSKHINQLLGLILFYGPLLGIIIPLFASAGASDMFTTLAVILSVPMSTVLFATAVVKKYDGKVIVAFLALNLGLFGGLMLLG